MSCSEKPSNLTYKGIYRFDGFVKRVFRYTLRPKDDCKIEELEKANRSFQNEKSYINGWLLISRGRNGLHC